MSILLQESQDLEVLVAVEQEKVIMLRVVMEPLILEEEAVLTPIKIMELAQALVVLEVLVFLLLDS